MEKDNGSNSGDPAPKPDVPKTQADADGIPPPEAETPMAARAVDAARLWGDPATLALYIETLATAYAGAGEQGKALVAAREAFDFCPVDRTDLRKRLEDSLKTYRRKAGG